MKDILGSIDGDGPPRVRSGRAVFANAAERAIRFSVWISAEDFSLMSHFRRNSGEDSISPLRFFWSNRLDALAWQLMHIENQDRSYGE